MHYLDLMTQATLLDHHVWTHPDTWSAAIENTEARRYSSGRRGVGFFGFLGICCLAIVILVLGIVYLMRRRNN